MPHLGSTVFVGSLAVLLLVSLTGFLLFFRALAPAFVERAETAARTRPFTCALVGFPTAAVGLTVAAVLSGAGPGPAKAAGLFAFALVSSFILGGVAGLAQRVGDALGSISASAGARLLRGAIVLELAMILPVVGWMLVLPIALAVGAGAACLALFGVKSRAAATLVSHGA